MENVKNQLIRSILEFRRKTSRIISSTPKYDYQNSRESFDEKQKKGTEFERFVVQRFDRTYFTLVEWRSDKNVDGIFPIMSKFPDLEFYFETQTESCHLAIECKWREYLHEDCISFNESHLEYYKHYQAITGYPTYIVFGLGNVPSFPKHVYIFRLSDIKGDKLHDFEIEKYRRHRPHDSFFFNCEKGQLR